MVLNGDDKELTAVVTPDELRLLLCNELGIMCYEEILAKRIDLAISMVLKGYVSVGKGAELAGMSYRDFINEFRKRGLKPFVVSESDLTLINHRPRRSFITFLNLS